jgi:hypothetical protein
MQVICERKLFGFRTYLNADGLCAERGGRRLLGEVWSRTAVGVAAHGSGETSGYPAVLPMYPSLQPIDPGRPFECGVGVGCRDGGAQIIGLSWCQKWPSGTASQVSATPTAFERPLCPVSR